MKGRTQLQQYLSPFRFWRLKFSGKRKFGVYWPLAFGIVAGVVLYFLPEANVAHDKGLIDRLSGLLSMLVGFYVAALGLTIAFESERLDAPPDSMPPQERDGTPVSWRVFATALMAYLVVISLFLYLASVAVLVLEPGVADLVRGYSRDALIVSRILLGGCYVGIFTHLLGVTLLAIFLLAIKFPEIKRAPDRTPPRKPALVSTQPPNPDD